MDVSEAIENRRAYRALAPVEITDKAVSELVRAVQLAPSCFNNQPWRLVLVRDPGTLAEMHTALSRGNEWARKASLIIAVCARKEDDCVIRDRLYYRFDCGLAVGQMVLRATEMDLVAHPIAGFSPKKVRDILGIPGNTDVITLVIVGARSDDLSGLEEHQASAEISRPERLRPEEFAYPDRYGTEGSEEVME